MDVHRAARIGAIGHGGQIVLSQATRDLVGYDDLRDLGMHRLKDLTAPERLYQLGGSDSTTHVAARLVMLPPPTRQMTRLMPAWLQGVYSPT